MSENIAERTKKTAVIATLLPSIHMPIKPKLENNHRGYETIFVPKHEFPSSGSDNEIVTFVNRITKLNPSLAIMFPTITLRYNITICVELSKKLNKNCKVICLFDKEGPSGNMVQFAGQNNIQFVKISHTPEKTVQEIIEKVDMLK